MFEEKRTINYITCQDNVTICPPRPQYTFGVGQQFNCAGERYIVTDIELTTVCLSGEKKGRTVKLPPNETVYPVQVTPATQNGLQKESDNKTYDTAQGTIIPAPDQLWRSKNDKKDLRAVMQNTDAEDVYFCYPCSSVKHKWSVDYFIQNNEYLGTIDELASVLLHNQQSVE